jgi:hypothetical protein
MQEGQEEGQAGEEELQEEEVTRHTFVVQVHPEGISTVENLTTHERVRVSDMAAVGPLLERWLSENDLGSEPAPVNQTEETG